MSYNIEKALSKVITNSRIINNTLLTLDFNKVESFKVVPTPAQQTNSRLDTVIAGGEVVRYGYNRDDLRKVIEEVLGLNSEVRVTGEVNSESIAAYYTSVGINILPEDIEVTNIINKAVFIKTTNQSLRYYGEVMLSLVSNVDGVAVYLESGSGDILTDQSGNPLVAQETIPVENEAPDNTETNDIGDDDPIDNAEE